MLPNHIASFPETAGSLSRDHYYRRPSGLIGGREPSARKQRDAHDVGAVVQSHHVEPEQGSVVPLGRFAKSSCSAKNALATRPRGSVLTRDYDGMTPGVVVARSAHYDRRPEQRAVSSQE